MQENYLKICKHNSKNLHEGRGNALRVLTDHSSNTRDSSSDSNRKVATKLPLPIPKGQTPYALAKIAEYKDRNLDKAEYYYNLAIRKGERVISAIKDLASLLHQRGKTQQACEFLKNHRHLFKNDVEKFENLYNTLEKQLNASTNSLNKSLKISNLTSEMTEQDIKALFENPIRIQKIEFKSEEYRKVLNHYCILKFNSHSSARKTLEGFHQWERFKVEWINAEGNVVGDAHYYRQKMQDYRKEHPTFDYQVFERDPHGYIYCLPLDSSPLVPMVQNSEQDSQLIKLLGNTLFSTIFSERVECC